MREQTGSDSGAPLWRQSFLTALPIVLTLMGGFAVNWYQGQEQHSRQLAQEAAQAKKVGKDRMEAEKARRAEAARLFKMQERELAAQRSAQDRQLGEAARLASLATTEERERLTRQHAIDHSRQIREFQEAAERQRRQNEADLILEVIKVGDLNVARGNIDFLLAAGLVRDPGGRIADAARKTPPVLPTPSGSLVAARDFSEAGPLAVVDPERPVAGISRSAVRLLACAQGEFNRDIEERRSADRLAAYFEGLGFGDGRKTDLSTLPWNAAFVSYCVRIAGLSKRILPSARGMALLESAQRSGLAVDATAPGFQFRPGDIYVLLRTSNPMASHSGIVISVTEKAIEGVEGNLNNGVLLVTRNVPLQQLRGVIRAPD